MELNVNSVQLWTCVSLTLAPGFPDEPSGPCPPMSPFENKREWQGRVESNERQSKDTGKTHLKDDTHSITDGSNGSHLALFSTLTLWRDSENHSAAQQRGQRTRTTCAACITYCFASRSQCSRDARLTEVSLHRNNQNCLLDFCQFKKRKINE